MYCVRTEWNNLFSVFFIGGFGIGDWMQNFRFRPRSLNVLVGGCLVVQRL